MTEPKPPTPEQYARELLDRSNGALVEAIVAIKGEDHREDNPLEVFPKPSEVRNEDPGLNLNDEQEAKLRAAVSQLGFERPTDEALSDVGLQGAHVIIEGGQPHKIVAELLMVVEDEAARPKTIVLSASPHRKITNDAEKASARKQLGQEPETEYDVSCSIAAKFIPNFAPHAEEKVLPVGYDIHNNFALVEEPTGQFVEIGMVGETNVVMMKIDGEAYKDEKGKERRHQPGTAGVLRIIAGASETLGDNEAPLAFVTSGTYQPSRTVDAARVALETNRVVGVATYGTQRLAEVNGTEIPEPRRLEQLPGELHHMANQVAALERVLESQGNS